MKEATTDRVASQIAVLEDRIVNSRTLEGAAALHDRLDALRARQTTDARTEYERGYQAGYHAAMRKANKPPECDHNGIGLPTCRTCRPRTLALLNERDPEMAALYADGHDLACGRYEGHPDPLCTKCAATEADRE